MKNVGYFHRTRYWQVYAFNNPPEGYLYKRAINIPFHTLGIDNRFLQHSKITLPFQNCDLYHTYNSVVTGKKPWVVEVESTVPRYGHLDEESGLFKWGINKLRSDYCRGIIFSSECTRELNQENFDRWGITPEKCHVVYRAVEPYKPLPRTGEEQKFTILFVGNGFYRKGGWELLQAFKKIEREDVRLVIISNFEVDWKIYPSDSEKKFVEKEIERNDKIKAYKNLPHTKVIEWMRKSDVFVNTTYADTFNNAILEALSCELPVVVSDVRAIPEFVKEGFNGYMVKPDPDNRKVMIEFIYQKLIEYYSDSELIALHSQNAKQMVVSKFLIEHRNKKMADIYNNM